MKTAKYVQPALFIVCALFMTPARAQQSASPIMTQGRLNLMPVPGSVEMRTGRLPITGSFNVAIKDYADDRLKAGIARMIKRLSGRTVLTLPLELAANESTAKLVVQCERAGDAIPSVAENESYSLEITDQQARLRAPTVIGALRGLETLLQLLQGDRDGYYLPGVRVEDQPRFAWRGLLIDVGRHYEPLEVLKRNLDAMAAVKLNVLHWHLSEDQGFRVESRKFPKLHGMGSDGLYYTQDQVREIIAYAARSWYSRSA